MCQGGGLYLVLVPGGWGVPCAGSTGPEPLHAQRSLCPPLCQSLRQTKAQKPKGNAQTCSPSFVPEDSGKWPLKPCARSLPIRVPFPHVQAHDVAQGTDSQLSEIRTVPFVPSLPPVPCLLPGSLGCSLAASWVLPGCGTTKGEQGSAREAREQPRGPAAREQPGSSRTDQEQLRSYPTAYLQFIYSLSTAYPTAYLQSISPFLRKRTNA